MKRHTLPLIAALSLLLTSPALAKAPRGMVIDAVSATGPLSHATVQEVVEGKQEALEGCFATARKEDKKLKGAARIAFTISAEGKVLSAALERSTLKKESLHRCLLEVARGLSFEVLEAKEGEEAPGLTQAALPLRYRVEGEQAKVREALRAEVLGHGSLKNIFGDTEGLDAKMDDPLSANNGGLIVGRGVGGMGMRGTGKGGGGEGYGRIGGLGKIDTGKGKKKQPRYHPKLSNGTPTFGTSCVEDNFRRVIAARSNAFKYCYHKELQSDPKLAGEVVLSWKIDAKGRVDDVTIERTTLNNAKVEGCLTRLGKRLRFARPKAAACEVSYPFTFSSMKLPADSK